MNSHLHVAITDEELSEWADKRADDAGRLARELIASRNGQKVPQDVTKLVIAARVVAFEDQSREAIRALDIASEAFADRVPWDGEPALSPPAVPGEVHAQLALIKHLAEYTTEKNWDDKRLYIMQAVDRALSVPLPEIEGGDKGDGAETITESAGRRRTELAIAEYLKVRDESMGTPDADNAERLQSAKDIHSLVIRQQGTRTRLSERNAAALAAPSAAIEGGDKRDARINWDNPEDTVVKMFVKYDVEGYVEEYEFCGEGGDYSPNERERTLLVDAIYGVVANLHEELRKIIPSSPNQGETE